MNNRSHFLFLFTIVLLIVSCVKVQKLQRFVINAIHLKDVNLTEQDISKEGVFYWNYSHNGLYISDNLHKKVFLLNSNNRVSFELGNIFDTSTQKQNEGGGWEDVLQKLQEDFTSDKNSTKELSKEGKSVVSPNNSVVKVNYKFQNIGRVVPDNDGNLYVEHIFLEDNSPLEKTEILKFSQQGKFLYKIGAEGRDNPPFKEGVQIQNLYTDASNGLWVQYHQEDKLYIRYYSSFGKNILFFSEEKIAPIIAGYMTQNFEESKYIIEDIFPVMDSQRVLVVLDIYKEGSNNDIFLLKKEILTLDKNYALQDIFSIKDPSTQIYGITGENELYGFRYDDEGYILEVYDKEGNIKRKNHFIADISYYKRIGLDLTPEGSLVGGFIKSKDLVFILWK